MRLRTWGSLSRAIFLSNGLGSGRSIIPTYLINKNDEDPEVDRIVTLHSLISFKGEASFTDTGEQEEERGS
jgi:hypothetical protein